MRRVMALFRWMLGYGGIPLMARPTFRREIISSVFAAIGGGAMMSQFTQLFARKSLNAPPIILALLMAEMCAGNLSGVFLAGLLRRRRRVPCVVAARVMIAVLLAPVAFLPAREGSALAYAALLLLPAILAAVSLNVQTSIWHSNYPTDVRGRIFSRLLAVKLATAAVTVKLSGYALDAWPWAHRLLYPLAAAAMVASAIVYSRIRVRGERLMLRESTEETTSFFSALRLLWRDRPYAVFMFWQMISGGMVVMCAPVIVLVLTDHLGVDYARGTTAVALLPMGICVAVAPLAGRLFDTISITRFRGLGAAFWGCGRLIIFAAALAQSWAWVLAGFAVQGLGRAMGGVAYNIAHTRFSPPGRGQLYMGVHMTLQGIRGMTLPFVGVLLYQMPGVGLRLLPVAAALQLATAAGFAVMRGPRPQKN